MRDLLLWKLWDLLRQYRYARVWWSAHDDELPT